jgi:hypothetical protein
MNNIRILIVLVCLLTGIIILQRAPSFFKFSPFVSKETVKASAEKAAVTIPSPTVAKANEIKPTDSVSPVIDKEQFIYPNASGIAAFENTIIFESNDDPMLITDWYKDVISNNGMTTKTFVLTKSNDNIFNNLVGSLENKELRVEIKRLNSQLTVTVLLTFINY